MTSRAIIAALIWAVVSAPGAALGEPRRANTVTIAAAGDVLLHGRVVAAARAHEHEGGLVRALTGLTAALTDEDLALANLEVPLTTKIAPRSGGRLPVLGAPPEVAQALAKAGIDAVSVANNHAHDQGARGLELTLEALDLAGVGAAGVCRTSAATCPPWVSTSNGIRLSLLAFTQPMNRPLAGRRTLKVARLRPKSGVIAAVAAARKQADVVMVALHWSRDFLASPTRSQRLLARELVDAGADIILGTGPHLLQPVERLATSRGQAVVAYSLGNLISPQGYLFSTARRVDGHRAAVHPGSRDGAVLRIEVGLGPTGRIEVGKLTAVPLWTANNHLIRGRKRPDIRVLLLKHMGPDLYRSRLAAIRKALGPSVSIAARP